MSSIYEGIGIEELIDQIEIVLRERLNDEMEIQQETWKPADEARADMRGIDYVPIDLEPVEDSAFHVGYIPSLVLDEAEMTLDWFPYVAITPNDTAPDPEDPRQDQLRVNQNLLSIHAIAKSSLDEGAEFAFRRSARMAEAIYKIVLGDNRLKHKLKGVSNPSRIRRSEPFRFNPEGLEDGDHFWMACGTDYTIKNYSAEPGGI